MLLRRFDPSRITRGTWLVGHPDLKTDVDRDMSESLFRATVEKQKARKIGGLKLAERSAF